MSLEKTLGTAALIAATSAASADTLNLLEEYVDFGNRMSISTDGSTLYNGGLTFNPSAIASGPTGVDLASAGTSGQAYDEATGFRYVNFGNSYEQVGIGILESNPINNVTAMSSYNNFLMFVNDLGDFAVRDATNGQTSVYNNLFDFSVGGMSVELGDDSMLKLITGDANGTGIFQYNMSGDLFSGLSLDLLASDVISGNTAFGIDGLDFKDGKLYTTTLGGTASFDYNLITVIPTPSSLAIASIGLAGLAGAYKRRRE